jgi:hypothetical protein
MTRRCENGKPDSGEAWGRRAPALADWVLARLVVRTDVWGGYVRVEDRGKEFTRRDGTKGKLPKSLTRPAKAKRGKEVLTRNVIVRHFRPRSADDIIGIHTTSPENFSRWGATEVDRHSEDAGPDPEVNWRAALCWYERAVSLGWHPLLTDSDGKGGYHLRLLFAELVPTRRVFWYIRWLTRNFHDFGFAKHPETFPKQVAIAPDRFGNWLRVFGMHHTEKHWSRVWDGSRWLDGNEAVEFILSLSGDPATLIPEDIEAQYRVPLYLAKLPHLCEGQGRDDIAYNLLAFLVRDLALQDEEALDWAEEWDRGNSPPKGRDRLREILANVHQYGQRAYGSGLDRGASPSSTAAGAVAPPPAQTQPDSAPQDRKAREIIREDLKERFGPVFRRKGAIFSNTEGREVRRGEVLGGAPSPLIEKLKTAVDAPVRSGTVDEGALPKLYQTWAPTAWQDLLGELDEEEVTAAKGEVSERAVESFHDRVAAALRTIQPIGTNKHTRHGETEVQRLSLIECCQRFAKRGKRWESIRSYKLWCRRSEETDALEVALHIGLFSQLPNFKDLADIGPKKFARLCDVYGVGWTGDEARVKKQRCIRVHPEFLADLLLTPNEDEPAEDASGADVPIPPRACAYEETGAESAPNAESMDFPDDRGADPGADLQDRHPDRRVWNVRVIGDGADLGADSP